MIVSYFFNAVRNTIRLSLIAVLCIMTFDARAASFIAQCPQLRATKKAPDEFYLHKDPLPADSENTAAGKTLYSGKAGNVACVACHGTKGRGGGVLAGQFDPPPRNFSCGQTFNSIPDGQLFWIIRFGSPGTSMPAHKEFNDKQIWQLILYLRQFAN